MHKLTPDGRRLREVVSYARRGNRFTPRQQDAWDAHHAAWVIPVAAVMEPDVAVSSWFGRRAPLIVEIGSGVGEATAALATRLPDHDILALEVWRPGIAEGLRRVADAGVSNVRFCEVDAVWMLSSRLAEDSLDELWTFFPDPWPKSRHHKRRLVSESFASLAASRLRPGGVWRLATDWAEYADHMTQVLGAERRLTGGPVDRWDERPVTKFERKGLAAGREITDLAYRRT